MSDKDVAAGRMPAGRPRKEINVEEFKKMIGHGCTIEECADILGCNSSTLYNNFPSVIKEGRALRNESLRKMQWNLANHSAAMAIWLGKNLLGQKDSPIVIEDATLPEANEGVDLKLLNDDEYREFSRLLDKAKVARGQTPETDLVQ